MLSIRTPSMTSPRHLTELTSAQRRKMTVTRRRCCQVMRLLRTASHSIQVLFLLRSATPHPRPFLWRHPRPPRASQHHVLKIKMATKVRLKTCANRKQHRHLESMHDDVTFRTNRILTNQERHQIIVNKLSMFVDVNAFCFDALIVFFFRYNNSLNLCQSICLKIMSFFSLHF